jgi:hypothetical protein
VFQEIVSHDGETASRTWLTGPALELELQSWNPVIGQGSDSGHHRILDQREGHFLEDRSRDLRTSLDIVIAPIKDITSPPVGTRSPAPREHLLNSRSSSPITDRVSVHHQICSSTNELFLRARLYPTRPQTLPNQEPSSYTQSRPSNQEPSSYTQTRPPNQELSSYTRTPTPNQEPRFYAEQLSLYRKADTDTHTSISTKRNSNAGLSTNFRAPTSSAKSITTLIDIPQDLSVKSQATSSPKGERGPNPLGTKCPTHSIAADAGRSAEPANQPADHGELLFDLKMQPVQPRRLKKKTYEQRLHYLRLRKTGGACEKHKLNKRAVSDTLLARLVIAILMVLLTSVIVNSQFSHLSRLLGHWMKSLQNDVVAL